MITERFAIEVINQKVEVVFKDIKNLHLAGYPPNGRVRVAAPLRLQLEAVRLAVISRLGWIRRQQDRLQAQVRQSEREFVTGETHYFQGRRHRLRLVESDHQLIRRNGNATLELRAREGSTRQQRETILSNWYRRELSLLVPPLVEKWRQVIGAEPSRGLASIFVAGIPGLILMVMLAGGSAPVVDATEGALASQVIPTKMAGTGFGVLAATHGVGDLASGMLVGVAWTVVGAPIALGIAAGVSVLAWGLLTVMVPARPHPAGG